MWYTQYMSSINEYLESGEIVPGVVKLPPGFVFDSEASTITLNGKSVKYVFPEPVTYNAYNPRTQRPEPRINYFEVRWVSLQTVIGLLNELDDSLLRINF